MIETHRRLCQCVIECACEWKDLALAMASAESGRRHVKYTEDMSHACHTAIPRAHYYAILT